MEIEDVLRLMDEGLTQKEIAERLGISYGSLKYQLTKYRGQKINRTDSEHTEIIDIDFDHIEHHEEADRLTALPINTTSLYVYWSITEKRKKEIESYLNRSWHAAEKRLRIYDVSFIDFNGDNAHRYWDVFINNFADNWIVRDIFTGCSFIVDYGVTAQNGNFVTVLRSNALEKPPEKSPSQRESRLAKIEYLQSDKPGGHPEWLDAFTGYTLAK